MANEFNAGVTALNTGALAKAKVHPRIMKTKSKSLILLLVTGIAAIAGSSYGQPSITIQPDPTVSYFCLTNASLTFRAAVTGTGTISYQWQTNGVNVPGEVSSNLTISGITGLSTNFESFNLTLVATDNGGPTTSSAISITTYPSPPVAYTNYLDTFSRPDGTAINGLQPDVDPRSQVWAAGPGFIQTNGGSVTWNGHEQAYLPFPSGGPQWGHVYVFSCDLNPLPSVAHPDDWEAISLSTANNPSDPNLYDGAVPWLLARADRSGTTYFGNGFSSSINGASYDPVGTPATFTIVLDCTTGDSNANTGWTVTFFQDGVYEYQSSYGANPAGILYIGIGGGGYGTCGGTFDNVKFTDSIIPPPLPTITDQPMSQNIYSGLYTNGYATFSAMVGGAPPFSYQWKHAGTNLPAATNISLTISNVQPSNAGIYNLVVSNLNGYVVSSNAVLQVFNTPLGSSIIYDDSFSRTGDLSTNDIPDVVDFGGNTWLTAPGMVMDGSELVRAPASSAEAYLPFIPQWGHVYVLGCDLNPTNGGSSWEAMGFADNTSSTNSGGFYIGAQPWILATANRGLPGSLQTFLSFVNAPPGGANHPTAHSSGYTHLSIILDTTVGNKNNNTGWVVQYTEDQTLLNSTVFSGFSGVSTNPGAIQFIGVGGDTVVEGAFDNFELAEETLGIQVKGGTATLTWPAGTLLSSTNVLGPWSPVTGASLPSYTAPANGPQKFYRLKLN